MLGIEGKLSQEIRTHFIKKHTHGVLLIPPCTRLGPGNKSLLIIDPFCQAAFIILCFCSGLGKI